jgi:hypothetical protein
MLIVLLSDLTFTSTSALAIAILAIAYKPSNSNGKQDCRCERELIVYLGTNNSSSLRWRSTGITLAGMVANQEHQLLNSFIPMD